MNKMKIVLEKFSAAFAVLFIGVIAMNFILRFFVKALALMLSDPFDFSRYFITTAFVLYGLYHANAWYLQSESKHQS